MKKINNKVALLIVLLMVSTLIACVRPASNQEEDTGDYESVVESILQSSATQTAIARDSEGIGGGASLEDELAAIATATEGVVSAVPTQAPTEVPIIPTAVPTPVEVVPTIYTLKEGEFPFCIARRFDIDAEALLSVNAVADDQVFLPGYDLIIPQDAAPFAGDRQLRFHPVDSFAVSSGETFNSIACFFGDLYPESIAAANLMDISDTLIPGTSLIIP